MLGFRKVEVVQVGVLLLLARWIAPNSVTLTHKCITEESIWFHLVERGLEKAFLT